MTARTLFEKIWRPTRWCRKPSRRRRSSYVDLHLTHEVTSPQAFAQLEARGLPRAAAGAHARDARPCRADRQRPGVRRRADPARVGGAADRRTRAERARVRLRAAGPARCAARHRARDRPGARAHAAGHDDRLRRQPHQHPRRLRHARLRHRHDRGRARARDAVPAAEQAEDARDHGRGRARRGRRREGPRARDHRPDRRRGRRAPGDRVPGRDDPRAVDGRAHDGLQHVDRGGRARRHDRAGRGDLRLPARPAAGAGGRGVRARGRALARARGRSRRGVRSRGRASMRRRSSR